MPLQPFLMASKRVRNIFIVIVCVAIGIIGINVIEINKSNGKITIGEQHFGSNLFHENQCQQFFKIANCSAVLNLKHSDRHKISHAVSQETMDKLRKTLLVIHYNNPQYGSAIRSFTLYSRIFAKIVFCGPSDNETHFWPHYTNDSSYSLTKEEAPFVAYGKLKARYQLNPYICVPMAVEKFPQNYTGVVAMSDDVIFNFWNIDRLNRSFDKIWLMSGKRTPFEVSQVCLFFISSFCFHEKHWTKTASGLFL